MSNRPILDAGHVSPEADTIVAGFHRDTVDAVAATVARERVVVVGMAQNPHVRHARQLLTREGVAFTYLGYGSYFSGWKRRLAIKLWAGFPTFPMVFVDGTLVGGHRELVKLRDGGGLKRA